MGNLDSYDWVKVFGVLNLVTGRLTTCIMEQIRATTQGKKGSSKQRHLQAGCARPLRDIARLYPAEQSPHVVLIVDRASWHRGALIAKTLKELSHIILYRLPSSSPSLQVIERFWKVLRRRATHNWLFETTAQLKKTLRNSLGYYQTLKHRGVFAQPLEKVYSRISQSGLVGLGPGLIPGQSHVC